MENILNYVKSLGVGCRHPHDEFLKDANDSLQPLKSHETCDFGDEDFNRKQSHTFSCHITGCDRRFETVMQYEAHYNSCHTFTCTECNKNLPNYHLLDLHIMENHDFFFAELSKKKPMFQCFLQECKEVFNNPKERQNHCITIHNFPSNFRFDTLKKKQNKKSKPAKGNDNEADSHKTKNHTAMTKKSSTFKNFSFGHSQSRRNPVFQNFSKDLIDSLPES